MLLKDKVAIITGAASARGLGFATAKLFADNGAKVVIIDLNGEASKTAAAALGEGHLGLAAQRLELAAQFGGQVGQAGQVGLHGVELADRLLLAPTVLEHTGGLLDEAAAGFGGGLQDGVQLTLADDDVHLPAEAGVAAGDQRFETVQPVAADPGGVRRVVAEPVLVQQVSHRCEGDSSPGVPVADLLDRFKQAAGKALDNDRMLLSEAE